MEDDSKNHIETWVVDCWASSGYLRYENLDISRVESSFNMKVNWIKGGIDCLRVAVAIRDSMQIPLQICLAFSLKSRRKPIGKNFSNYKELEKQFTSSPPTLYAFSSDQKIWDETPHVELSEEWLKIRMPGILFYYVEYLLKSDGDPDHRRSFWFISPWT